MDIGFEDLVAWDNLPQEYFPIGVVGLPTDAIPERFESDLTLQVKVATYVRPT